MQICVYELEEGFEFPDKKIKFCGCAQEQT